MTEQEYLGYLARIKKLPEDSAESAFSLQIKATVTQFVESMPQSVNREWLEGEFKNAGV